MCSTRRAAGRACSTAPARRRGLRLPSAMPAAFPGPDLYRCRCRACWAASGRCTGNMAGCPGPSCAPRRSASPARGLARRRITGISPASTSPRCGPIGAAPRPFAKGNAPAVGRPIVQPELARSLEEIAAEGAECLYRGALTQRLATGCAEAGTLVGEVDLAEFHAEIQQPIAIDYRGLTVLEAPPNSTGFVLLEELKIVENFDLEAMGLGSADAVHVMVEAKKLAFADRERWAADPRTIAAPLSELLSADYAARLASRIDLRRAAPTHSIPDAAGDTTYFCTADGEGIAVSGLQSINSGVGSGVTAADTGILLNNRMAYWHLDPSHPNHLRPGRRVRHTMNPPLDLKDGKLWAVFGTPGADNQVQINFQILTAMADFGLDPQQAAEMPRWTSNVPGQYANYPHDGPDVLTMERRFPEAVRAELARRGHPVDTVGDLEGPCSVEIIRRDAARRLRPAPRRLGLGLVGR